MTALSTTLTDTLEKAGIGQELMKALEAEFRKMRIPTGFITGWRGKTPPEGWLAVNGQEVYQSVYPELYAFLKAQPNARTGTDGIGPYVHCDMPHHRVIELTTNPNEVGQLVEAGLPDINGGFGNVVWTREVRGAYKVGEHGSQSVNRNVVNQGAESIGWIDFQASFDSPVHGKSNTVQTNALRLLAIVKY